MGAVGALTVCLLLLFNYSFGQSSWPCRVGAKRRSRDRANSQALDAVVSLLAMPWVCWGRSRVVETTGPVVQSYVFMNAATVQYCFFGRGGGVIKYVVLS